MNTYPAEFDYDLDGKGDGRGSVVNGAHVMVDYRVWASQELHCLRDGPSPNEHPRGIIVEFIAQCIGEAQDVIDRSRSVLSVVVQASLGPWPADDQWPKMLPTWFMANCAKDQSQEEADTWLKWWRSLDRERQVEVEREKQWPFRNWIYWMQPENRHWFWWNAGTLSENTASVSIVVDGWPFPWGALSWLLRASGAKEVLPLNG